MDMDRQLDIIDLNSRELTAMCHNERASTCAPRQQDSEHGLNVVMAAGTVYKRIRRVKAYVLSFSRALGVELKDKGIHVMTVCPGWIKTEFFQPRHT